VAVLAFVNTNDVSCHYPRHSLPRGSSAVTSFFKARDGLISCHKFLLTLLRPQAIIRNPCHHRRLIYLAYEKNCKMQVRYSKHAAADLYNKLGQGCDGDKQRDCAGQGEPEAEAIDRQKVEPHVG